MTAPNRHHRAQASSYPSTPARRCAAVGGVLVGGAGVPDTPGRRRTAPIPDRRRRRRAVLRTPAGRHRHAPSGLRLRRAHAGARNRPRRTGADDAAVSPTTPPGSPGSRRWPAEPELALLPARLTVTFGFGPGLYRAAGIEDRRPPSVADLPAFPEIDQLQPRWCGGDLLLQICADDPITVAHAQRMLVKDARPFASVRWAQHGFRRAAGVRAGTQRNLMGQLDGTTNPEPGTEAFERRWAGTPPPW